MLPFDNKSEFQVIVDMPEGTPLETTAAAASALADEALRRPEVTNVQTYAGTASPYNFNGLVRHYFLRREPNVADIQVKLAPKDERSAQSHEIAKRLRDAARRRSRPRSARASRSPRCRPARRCCRRWSPRSTARRRAPAWRSRGDVAAIFEQTPGVVDVDWYVEDDSARSGDARRRPREGRGSGLSRRGRDRRVVRMAGAGAPAGLLHDDAARRTCRSCCGCRARCAARSTRCGRCGSAAGAGRRRRARRASSAGREDPSIYHKNLLPVTYVTADVAGAIESPVYAILAAEPRARAR